MAAAEEHDALNQLCAVEAANQDVPADEWADESRALWDAAAERHRAASANTQAACYALAKAQAGGKEG